jgi:hypothetical protein
MIGLTSYWNTSVEAFHKQFGGTLFTEELIPNKSKFGPLKRRVQEQLQEIGFIDPWDNELYAYAKQLFDETIEKLQLVR